MNDPNDMPTEFTATDIDKVTEMLSNGYFDLKQKPCWKCSKEHFPNYGHHLQECDECYFARFPKEEVEAFYRSFF